MTSIAIVGSVNLDLVATVKRLPAPGETVTDAVLRRLPGGKGANQALAARRLGADVQLVACVGDDASADEALALLVRQSLTGAPPPEMAKGLVDEWRNWIDQRAGHLLAQLGDHVEDLISELI